ncbi:PUL domain-containing protein [Apiosordaria backusii]|uniref:PUL domain-containing protein n=1 Tax=Apiosordaria backusii TaxID=314023 RepID=A0AA40BJP0_9PEZI|nr:PUL domain-containing protein [Apiosordaria backusii]
MDVTLFVYDLSRGMARQMSASLLGFQIDAIYHTSIKLNGLEYVYDGNVVAIRPGFSHLGQPEQQLHLGTTDLPMDVIEEYLDSLREIYTVEAYDLWKHNCNNFSNDFAMFLLGKGIPEHIVNLPQTVLDSPFGQMLMPMLNQQINSNRRQGGILGIQQQTPGSSVKPKSQLHQHLGKVHNVSSLAELDQLLEKHQHSCAVIFFTSATCPPCKLVYPLYDELAAEIGDKGVLIKADISQAFDIGSRYSVRATPTFITFLKGKQENQWSGADPATLRGNIQLLVQMAWPRHRHESLNLPTISNPNAKPVLYTRLPPLAKLLAKLPPDASSNPAVQDMRRFLETRASQGPAEATLPNIPAFLSFVGNSLSSIQPDKLFPLIDLLRCALVDPRVSSVLAEDDPNHKTVLDILQVVNTSVEKGSCPYPLRLVTVQMACNLFSSHLYEEVILSHQDLRHAITESTTACFRESETATLRVSSAGLLYNLVLANSKRRRAGPGDVLPGEEQAALAGSVLEAIGEEKESAEALEGMLNALGLLVYLVPQGEGEEMGELEQLLVIMEADGVVMGKVDGFGGLKGLIGEVGGELLGKGLRKA